MKIEEDLTKLSLAANTAIQDIQSLAEDGEILCKENVAAMVTKSRGCVLSFKDKIEEVERNAKLTDKETDRIALEKLVENSRLELAHLNAMLRRVNLTMLAIMEKQEKETLLSGGEAVGPRKRVIDKQTAAKASSSITESLVSTSKMMAEHLQRSNDTIETLSNSSKGITATNEELKSMHGHIKNARSLLTKYGRKEMSSKLFIFLAVVFFLATVLYILKKRLWSTSISTDSYSHSQNAQEPLSV